MTFVKKKIASVIAILAIVSVMAISAVPSALETSVTTGVQTAVTETLNMVLALLPIALTILAATWGTKKAVRFFKGMA
jgi:hypothetical protein